MTEYALDEDCILKAKWYEMWLCRERDFSTFMQIWLYTKQRTVCPLLQIFPAERWADTHRHRCGACSGRLIRTPVDNTGVIAYGLWLISTHSLAAERRSKNIKYGHTERYYATKRHYWRTSSISVMAVNTVAPMSQASLEPSWSVAANGLPVTLRHRKQSSHCFSL